MSGDAPPFDVAWLGRQPYAPIAALQERLREGVIDGRSPETLLLLEHDPVVTLGRSADPAHVLVDEAALAARGIARVAASRGGDVTFHGPGQLVAYPIVRVDEGVRAYVAALAAAVVELAAELGVAGASFREERPGVWVGDRKLCAFGVHVRHRVAMHGLALNVTTPPRAFDVIVPCGLAGLGVTSLAELLASPAARATDPHVAHRPPARDALTPETLAPRLAAALGRSLRRSPRFLGGDAIRALLS